MGSIALNSCCSDAPAQLIGSQQRGEEPWGEGVFPRSWSGVQAGNWGLPLPEPYSLATVFPNPPQKC